MMRRRSQDHLDWALPWQLEVAFLLIGLICVPVGMYWFAWEITSPATAMSQAFGVPVDVQPVVTALRPMIWIFGLIVGWRVRCWIRGLVIRQLNQVL